MEPLIRFQCWGSSPGDGRRYDDGCREVCAWFEERERESEVLGVLFIPLSCRQLLLEALWFSDYLSVIGTGQRSRSHRPHIHLIHAISQWNSPSAFLRYEFHYIWQKKPPLGVEDELIRNWWSKLKVAVNLETCFLALHKQFIHKLWQVWHKYLTR